MGDINLRTKINNLDERVNAVQNELSVQVGELTSVTGSINIGNTSLKKYGRVAVLGLMQTGVSVTANTWTVIAKLPKIFITSTPLNGIGLIDGTMGRIQINSNGNIQIYYSQTVSNIQVLCDLSSII